MGSDPLRCENYHTSKIVPSRERSDPIFPDPNPKLLFYYAGCLLLSDLLAGTGNVLVHTLRRFVLGGIEQLERLARLRLGNTFQENGFCQCLHSLIVLAILSISEAETVIRNRIVFLRGDRNQVFLLRIAKLLQVKVRQT